MTFTDSLRIVRRRWVIVALLVLAITGGLTAYELHKPPLYETSAEVLLLNDQTAASLVGLVPAGSSDSADRFAETQRSLARVPTIARQTLARIGLTDRTPNDLLKQSSVSTIPNQNLLKFAVTDRDPKLAAKLATAYAQQFPVYRRQLDAQAFDLAEREVEARLSQLRISGQQKSILYRSLTDRLQQLSTLAALQTTSSLVVQPADQATKVQPRPVRALSIGLFLGLLLGIAAALIRDVTDTRLRSADEIAEEFGVPLLARIPPPPRRLGRNQQLVSIKAPQSVDAECFRILRTNLEFTNIERQATTIMVTSAVPGEGKSTTVANLGVAMARAGKTVIVVDLDLRRPVLGRLFDIPPGPGIAEVALGRVELGRAIVAVPNVAVGGSERAADDSSRSHNGSLLFVRTGVRPPNPDEFIASHVFGDILKELKTHADVVLIDSAPLLTVGDAMALSARTDAVVMVARLGIARRPVLLEARRVLLASPAPVLGVVVTGVAAPHSGYGEYGSTSKDRNASETDASL